MTILLPKDPLLFHKAFDEICDRILESRQDEVFYALFIQFIVKMRAHPLFKDVIGQIETGVLTQQAELCTLSLDYHEYNWKKIWQYHHSYRSRKELVHIKRMVTYPRETSSSSLHNRLSCAMWEFRAFGFISSSPSAIKAFFQEKTDKDDEESKNKFHHRSSFFRPIEEIPQIFRRAQSNIEMGINIAKHFSPSKDKIAIRQKVTHYKSRERENLTKILRKILKQKLKPPRELKAHYEALSSLFSPLGYILEHKFEIPGRNNDQKRQTMRNLAELNFDSCWKRFMDLEHCYSTPTAPLPLKRFTGKWNIIREQAWNAAWEKSKQETLQFAHAGFCQKLSEPSNDSISVFLPVEKQIHRRDYEEFLRSFRRHVHMQLYNTTESPQHDSESNPHLMSEGTQTANFVIQLARAYWKVHPQAKYDEVFNDYLAKCPLKKALSRPSWERIVRERKLDPRPPGSKKRGSAKKILQI